MVKYSPYTDVVIPVRNEESTIKDIVRAFANHHRIGKVIVSIDPETSDNTADVALENGATIAFSDEHGKGQTLLAGMFYVDTKRVIFCDADITGLLPAHVYALAQHPPDDAMIIGVPDFPDDIANARIYQSWPWVSGQRSVPTSVVKRLELHGYLVEVQLNVEAKRRGIPPRLISLKGVKSTPFFSGTRLIEMELDRQWGIEHGVFSEQT